jgi:hypothetical protein
VLAACGVDADEIGGAVLGAGAIGAGAANRV